MLLPFRDHPLERPLKILARFVDLKFARSFDEALELLFGL
jgi:hypothetical protein